MKRLLALLLTIVMIVGILPIGVFAATQPTITLTTDATENMTIGDTFTVTATLSDNTGFASLTLSLLWNSSAVKFNGFETEYNSTLYKTALKDSVIAAATYDNITGKVSFATDVDIPPNGTLYIANFEVVGYGDCDIMLGQSSIETFTFANAAREDIAVTIDQAVVSDLIITEPAAQVDPYEIYYTLDSTADADTDAYTDYNIGDTVTATVSVTNKSGEDVYLQACDLYLTYDSNLTYTGNTLTKGVAYDSAGVAYGADGFSGTVSHIQAIGASETAADISIQLNSGATATLGTITFSISDAAVYDTQMPITLTTATNIGVGYEATGNKTSYSPENVGTVSGAEVMTTYTVTWKNEDGTDLGTSTVGRNKMPAYDGATPTKAATAQYTYTFDGWTPTIVKATADATYTATYTSTVNSYTITWNDWDGDELKSESLAYGETPSYGDTAPSRAADSQYTYEFEKWTPVISAVTDNATYTANYKATPISYNITFNAGEGSLPEGVTSPMSYDCEDTTALPQPTLDGYKFNGWLLEATTGGWTAGTYSYTDTVTGKWGDVTLFAQWLDASFDVTFTTPENGSVSADPLAGDQGTEITLTATPNPGYKLAENGFNVIYTDENGDTQTVSVTDGKFNMPAADVTVSATFVKADLTITVKQTDTNGAVAVVPADKTTAQVGDIVTLTNTPNAGYELDAYTVTYNDGTGNKTVPVTVDPTTGNGTFTMPAYPVTVTASFKLAELAINIDDTIQHGSASAQDSEDSIITTAKAGETVTLVPAANTGYGLASWTVTYVEGEETKPVTMNGNSFIMPYYPVTVSATFSAISYTITYMDGDSEISNLTPATYTIESTDKLPSYSKTNYIFKGWKVTDGANDKWSANSVINAETALTGYYGNVTLTAQWDEALDYEIDDYKYAQTGYVMLRIATDSNTNAYTFDGVSMYYTTAENYLVSGSNATGVFYTLISNTYVSNGKLTEDGMAKLVAGTEEAATIDYDSGDINGDGVTNIADANIVYQMIVNGGGYYTDLGADGQTDTESRLMADMNKESYDSSVARATIADVNAIVNIINGTN